MAGYNINPGAIVPMLYSNPLLEWPAARLQLCSRGLASLVLLLLRTASHFVLYSLEVLGSWIRLGCWSWTIWSNQCLGWFGHIYMMHLSDCESSWTQSPPLLGEAGWGGFCQSSSVTAECEHSKARSKVAMQNWLARCSEQQVGQEIVC